MKVNKIILALLNETQGSWTLNGPFIMLKIWDINHSDANKVRAKYVIS